MLAQYDGREVHDGPSVKRASKLISSDMSIFATSFFISTHKLHRVLDQYYGMAGVLTSRKTEGFYRTTDGKGHGVLESVFFNFLPPIRASMSGLG